jgi:glycine cleavage system regulatory protein
MIVSLLVSVVGPDRPGLVNQLSRVITDAGGNWEGSRLIQLGGQFAGIVQVVTREESLAQLRGQLDELAGIGLTVSVIHSEDQAPESERSGEVVVLDVVGQDRPGIVAAISETLANEGVNVIELATDCRNAPMSGERLFHTTATVSVPASIDSDELRQRIEEIAGDLMVEIGR